MKISNKFILTCTSIILLGLIVYLLVNYKDGLVSRYERILALKDSEKHLTEDILRSYLTNSNRNIGLKLNQDITLTDTDGYEIKLCDLIGSRPKLIFRIADTYCSSCVDSGLESLSQNASRFLDEDIIVIGSFLKTDDYINFAKKANVSYRILQTKESIDLQVEELGFPYFVVINSKLKVLSCFIPNSSYPNYNDDYFVGIRHLLYKNGR